MMPSPRRGEVWVVEFEPARGAEIAQMRPAIVVSVDDLGNLPLRMVVPRTDWMEQYGDHAWFVRLATPPGNGLSKESGADGFQCKSFSLEQFVRKPGRVTNHELAAIVDAVVLCLGVHT